VVTLPLVLVGSRTRFRSCDLGLALAVALIFLHLHHLYPVPAYFATTAGQILAAAWSPGAGGQRLSDSRRAACVPVGRCCGTSLVSVSGLEAS